MDVTNPVPFQTNGGAIREDRIVLPIPPGVHWREVKAVEVPSDRGLGILPEPKSAAARKRADRRSSGGTPKPRKAQPDPSAGKVGILVGGRIKYVDRPGYVAPVVGKAVKKGGRRAKADGAGKETGAKIDPKYLAAARELRDRWLEHVNDWRMRPALSGKYDVSRGAGLIVVNQIQTPQPLLDAA